MNIEKYIVLSIFFTMLFCCLSSPAVAARTRVVVAQPVRPLTWNCLTTVSSQYNIPVAILLGILATEGGQPGEAVSNTNGTWDLGPFQINTCHVESVSAAGVSPSLLLTDSCVNAAVAGWILRRELNRSQNNLWDAVGAYHSRTPARHQAYIQSVRTNLASLRDVTHLLDFANGKRRSWK